MKGMACKTAAREQKKKAQTELGHTKLRWRYQAHRNQDESEQGALTLTRRTCRDEQDGAGHGQQRDDGGFAALR
jgi:hypothetical protein